MSLNLVMSYSSAKTAFNAATSIRERKPERNVILDGDSLIVEDLVLVSDGKVTVGWAENSRQKVAAAREFVNEYV